MHGEAYVAILFVGGLGSNSVRGIAVINEWDMLPPILPEIPNLPDIFFYRYVSWIY